MTSPTDQFQSVDEGSSFVTVDESGGGKTLREDFCQPRNKMRCQGVCHGRELRWSYHQTFKSARGHFNGSHPSVFTDELSSSLELLKGVISRCLSHLFVMTATKRQSDWSCFLLITTMPLRKGFRGVQTDVAAYVFDCLKRVCGSAGFGRLDIISFGWTLPPLLPGATRHTLLA